MLQTINISYLELLYNEAQHGHHTLETAMSFYERGRTDDMPQVEETPVRTKASRFGGEYKYDYTLEMLIPDFVIAAIELRTNFPVDKPNDGPKAADKTLNSAITKLTAELSRRGMFTEVAYVASMDIVPRIRLSDVDAMINGHISKVLGAHGYLKYEWDIIDLVLELTMLVMENNEEFNSN